MRSTLLAFVLIFSTACSRCDNGNSPVSPTTSPADGLHLYACHRARGSIKIDGKLSDADWRSAPWTTDCVSILGPSETRPERRTRCKLLYDDHALYLAAELIENHLWATDNTTRLYTENAFEIFLDPNSNGRDYWEIEINPKGAAWIVNMPKPYSQGGQLVESDLPGMKLAINLNGTLNDPTDRDRSWTVELAIPWRDIAQMGSKVSMPPHPGDDWRINLARVNQTLDTGSGEYRKDVTAAPEYTTWSPPGEVNLHIPESFGHLHFEP